MLKIKIITVGKLKEKYLKDGIQEYQKRLSKYLNLEMIELIDEKAPEKLSDAEVEMIKDKEGSRILSKIKDDEYVIALAIEGEMLESIALSNKIESLMASGKSKMTFVIGGSNGLSKKVYYRSQYLLSFSKMTFPHQLMKLILLEQIYRSFKIINNETYHK